MTNIKLGPIGFPGGIPYKMPSHREDRIKMYELRVQEEEKIRTSAFADWEAAGRPEGKDLEFWLEAERRFSGWATGQWWKWKEEMETK